MVSQPTSSIKFLVVAIVLVGLLGVGAFAGLAYTMTHPRLCYATNYEERRDSTTGQTSYIVTCDEGYQQVCGDCGQDPYTGDISCGDCLDLADMAMK